jgi:hypothetical protein
LKKEKMMQEYVYSLNEDEFMNLEDIENEIDERNSEEENIKITHVYRGEKVVQTHSMFVSGSDFIERITSMACEIGGEFSESYCSDIESKEHEKNIEKLVVDYLNKNEQQPNFYLVENVKEIPIAEITEGFESQDEQKTNLAKSMKIIK